MNRSVTPPAAPARSASDAPQPPSASERLSDRLRLTLGDWLMAGFCVLSLGFAVLGVAFAIR